MIISCWETLELEGWRMMEGWSFWMLLEAPPSFIFIPGAIWSHWFGVETWQFEMAEERVGALIQRVASPRWSDALHGSFNFFHFDEPMVLQIVWIGDNQCTCPQSRWCQRIKASTSMVRTPQHPTNEDIAMYKAPHNLKRPQKPGY